MKRRHQEYPAFTRKRGAPVRNALLVFSSTSLCWCAVIGYGLATSHLRYYQVVATREEVIAAQAQQLADADTVGNAYDHLNKKGGH